MGLHLRTSDAELATLRDLPNHHNFIHQNNVMYSIGYLNGILIFFVKYAHCPSSMAIFLTMNFTEMF